LEDDNLPGSIFSDAFVQVRVDDFGLLVLPPQLQFVPTVSHENQQELIVKKLGPIIAAIPHTPYTGLGLNFSWHLVPKDGDINRLCRQLFFVPNSPIYNHFETDNPRFGAYLSKDFQDFRLKLDI